MSPSDYICVYFLGGCKRMLCHSDNFSHRVWRHFFFSLTGLAKDPDLGTRDGNVVLVNNDPNGDPPSVQHAYSPAQVHVGKGKDTQVQRGGSRQDVSQKTGKRGLHTMSQRAEAGTRKAENKKRREKAGLFNHLLTFCRVYLTCFRFMYSIFHPGCPESEDTHCQITIALSSKMLWSVLYTVFKPAKMQISQVLLFILMCKFVFWM